MADDPHLRYCPTPGCAAILDRRQASEGDGGGDGRGGAVVTCAGCGRGWDLGRVEEEEGEMGRLAVRCVGEQSEAGQGGIEVKGVGKEDTPALVTPLLYVTDQPQPLPLSFYAYTHAGWAGGVVRSARCTSSRRGAAPR